MSERPTPAGAFFAWQPAGAGCRWLSCPRCEARVTARLLENLLETLCTSCGRNVAIERARQLESDSGAAALADRLVELGILEDEERSELRKHPDTPEGWLVDCLLDRGSLRRDLRLTVDLDPDAGEFAYDAAPLREIVLPIEIEQALELRRREGGVLTDLLRELVLQRLATSVRSVGAELGMECLRSGATQDPEVKGALPKRAMAEFQAFPLRRDGDALVVAVWDPLDLAGVADLESLVGGPVHAVLGEHGALADALGSMGAEPSEHEAPPLPPSGEAPAWVDALEGNDPLYGILLEALEEGAEEVLIEPQGRSATLRFRVRGELRKERLLPAEIPALLVDRLAGAAESGPTMSRIRCGTARWEVSGLPVQVSYRVLETPLGPSLTLDLEDEHESPPVSLNSVGLSLESLAAFEALLERERGLIVVAAPPRAGKTQAYYAILERAIRLRGGVISLERKVRRVMRGATQLDLELAGDQLSSLLDPPPDWLGIDGSLEGPVLRLAVDAVFAGRRVVLTVPAPDGAAALLRLELAGIPRTLLERTVTSVLARRAVPHICAHCRVARDAHDGLNGITPWIGLGCAACADQGTSGLQPLAELVRPRRGGGVVSVAGSPLLAERARELIGAGEVPVEGVWDLVGGAKSE